MRQAPDQSQCDCIPASDSILTEIQNITLPCDLVPTIKVPFLVTVSGHSKFTIAEPIKSRAKRLIPDVYHIPMWMNAFPPKSGVSLSIFPRSLISGVPLDLKLHCQLVFGSHGQHSHLLLFHLLLERATRLLPYSFFSQSHTMPFCLI